MLKGVLFHMMLWFLMGLQSGCINPHHVFDLFQNQSGPISNKAPGLAFYDWWRTQPGVLIVNSKTESCAAVHMMGYRMGEWPGQFCLLLSEKRFFTAMPTPELKNFKSEKIWSLSDISRISDAYWDDGREWIWLLVEQPGPQKILAVNSFNGRVVFQWVNEDLPLLGLYQQKSPSSTVKAYTSTSLITVDVFSQKKISTSPLTGSAPIQQFDNNNILYRIQGFSEIAENGRLAWQWQSKDEGQIPWGRKSVGLETDDFVSVFRTNSNETSGR